MHVEMEVVDEEALSNRGVSVIEGTDVELQLVSLEMTTVVNNNFCSISEDAGHVPVFLLLKLVE